MVQIQTPELESLFDTGFISRSIIHEQFLDIKLQVWI